MRMIVKTVALLLIVLGSALYGSEKGAVQFGSIKVRVTLEATPAVLRSAGSGGVYASGGTVLVNKRWLAIHVSYVPGFASARNIAAALKAGTGNARAVQSLPGRWIDDVTMRVRVAFPAENVRRSNVVYGMFTGECCLWSVRLDGRRRTMQMFVPPQLLDRYVAVSSTGRKEISLAPTDYRVLVEFVTRDGKLLGKSYEHTGSLRGNRAFAFFKSLEANPGTTVVTDALLPRSKTPWAWHQFSTFDYIKDVGKNGGPASGNQ